MQKHHSENEGVKRRYFVFLKKANLDSTKNTRQIVGVR